MVRINKFLAQCNLGSRRDVEEIIRNGLIEVNGEIVKDLSTIIDINNDTIKYNGKILKYLPHKIYIMLHKPEKYLVTKKDDFGRATVFDILPEFNTNLHYIGRLDYMSTGLLLLTNDGDFAQKVIHPRYKLPKVYKVTVKGFISKKKIDDLRAGIIIEGRKTFPAVVYIKSRNETKTVLKITIFEGRKRQIRKMIKSIGSEVLKLKRLQIGDLKLSKLPIGNWRYLTNKEIDSLLNYKQDV
jgi:23S rRNA pseudouridine2605 synthase